MILSLLWLWLTVYSHLSWGEKFSPLDAWWYNPQFPFQSERLGSTSHCKVHVKYQHIVLLLTEKVPKSEKNDPLSSAGMLQACTHIITTCMVYKQFIKKNSLWRTHARNVEIFPWNNFHWIPFPISPLTHIIDSRNWTQVTIHWLNINWGFQCKNWNLN